MRLLLLLALVGGAMATCETRLTRLVQESAGAAKDLSTSVIGECNNTVGTFTSAHTTKYNALINKALAISLKHMAISSNFGRDTVQRPGFQRLFRESSDERFEQAVDMIKYTVKRGGNLKSVINVQLGAAPRFQPGALPSLGLALSDIKDMYNEEESLHSDSLCLDQLVCSGIDGDLARRMQDYMALEVERSSRMASLTNKLAGMYTKKEKDLAEDQFDQMLLY